MSTSDRVDAAGLVVPFRIDVKTFLTFFFILVTFLRF